MAALAPVEGPDGQPKLLLLTREPMYEPLTQELPVFTEETMRETNEMVIKTGSVGAGVQQLLGVRTRIGAVPLGSRLTRDRPGHAGVQGGQPGLHGEATWIGGASFETDA